jgi:trehalose 6-phosphate phosphatase
VLVRAAMTQAGADGLESLLARPRRALVGLDFDGTLSPIVSDPAMARPAAGAPESLRRLAVHLDTLAIVTGRPAAVAAALLGFHAHPPAGNLVVLGHYGLERWTPEAGVVRAAGHVDDDAIETVRVQLAEVLNRAGAPQGTSIEDKGESVAVHVRRTAHPAAALELLREPLAELASAHGLRLEPGRLVLELRPPGVDKGRALEDLVRERGVDAVWYAGDDLGDLAAFDALVRLRADNVHALAICCASEEARELASRADLVLDGPTALVSFLTDVVGELEAGTR